MSESQFTSRLIRALRAALPGAFVRKLSDRYTAGLPDFFVVFDGRTTWFEVKLAGGRIAPLQRETLRLMRRAWFVVWDKNARRGKLMRPMPKCSREPFEISFSVPFSDLVERVVTLCKEVDP